MMNSALLKISLRQNAIFLPTHSTLNDAKELNHSTWKFISNATKLGFTFSEDLLRVLNSIPVNQKLKILSVLQEITGANKNWTPLVKGWNIPTEESIIDHIVTYVENIFGTRPSTTLPCGHKIPKGTFPIERYNGCPFCGTPFTFGEIESSGQASKLKVLELWQEKEMEDYFNSLLKSNTALDATQRESLRVLLKHNSVPSGIDIKMKETLMLVIDSFVDNEKAHQAQEYFNSPKDILRYLWYKKTGYTQIIKPKTIIKRISINNLSYSPKENSLDNSTIKTKNELKLKYSREQCRMIATWLNDLDLSTKKSCEAMHPNRGMWIRLIRAARLSEYSKKKGYEKLKVLLDHFYHSNYTVTEGLIQYNRLKSDTNTTFELLKERPGLFARSLFSNMLWFGPDITMKHFNEIKEKVPARLLITLNMYADIYFDKNASRLVKPLGGKNKRIPSNKLLQFYSKKEVERMKSMISELCIEVIKDRFSSIENTNTTMYIDQHLFNIPLSIGDRSETIQDYSSSLMGTKFDIEGNKVRLFLQWGEGLPAQHLDMDLSCRVAYPNRTEYCSYSQLVIHGCKHSGDIQRIPHKVGTAEYIDIDIDKLSVAGARYVSFTCNAFTKGSLAPNLVVGWMNSKYPMKISSSTGVAYDPSCVQQQIKITQTMNKGLVFGVLDVQKRQIIWLEMSFGGQVVQNLNMQNVEALIKKLDKKLKIGALLHLKADAQNMKIIPTPIYADEVYDLKWAQNTAKVTSLLVG